ncbi:MAG: putative Ser/Thr protein kinase [Akkermansiaceae bacterium]
MNPNYCPTCQSPIAPDAPGGFCTACLLRDAEEPASTVKHAAPSIDRISAAFPQLEVLDFIGQGGMGFVYKVRQPGLDRVVALKILSPALGKDPAFEERFSREARTLGQLQHPNIVTVFEHGEEGGFFYLLMEFVDGINLRQAMAAGRFSPEQALEVVPGICDALQAAHAQGICHRDIKPENVLLDRDGRVKIVDFGIALMVGSSERNFTLTATGGALGSAAYMAPEQHERPHDIDHRADIYSLGVVFYEMLTGELPLGRFPAPSERSLVDERVDEIVLRTLEKERDLRQQSAAEVKSEISGLANGARSEKDEKKEGFRFGVPQLMVGSVGLWLGGLVLGGMGGAGQYQGLLAVGAALFAVGFLGCLWSLWEMKTGKMPLKGRRILIALTIVPMCLGVIAGLCSYSQFSGSFPRQEGGLLVGCVLILLVACPLFWLALYLGRPLKARKRNLSTGLRTTGLVLGVGFLVAGGFYAKVHDGKWPAIGGLAQFGIQYPNLTDVSDDELSAWADEAAGKYKNDYQIEVDHGHVRIRAYCRDSENQEKEYSAKELSVAHVRSFLDRFFWLVPLDSSTGVANQYWSFGGSYDAKPIRLAIALLVSLGAFLICWLGRREMLWVVGAGVVFYGVLAVVPVWGRDSDQLQLVEGAPLEFFSDSELPVPDFSTPESAVRSFHEAASLGKVETVRRGASQALRMCLDQENEWEELMRKSDRVKTLRTQMDESRGALRVQCSSRYGGSGGAWVWVVKEGGEWRVDGLNYFTDSRNFAGPFTPNRVRRSTVEWTVRPTVTDWVLNGAGEEVRLAGDMKADVKKVAGYTVLLVHVGGHPVFMVIGKEYGGFMKTMGSGGILSGSVSLGKMLDFKVPGGNKATINSRTYDLSKGRVFYLESGGAMKQFAKHPRQIGSEAVFSGMIDDIFSETSPGYVVRSLLAAATEGHLSRFRRRLSRSFLAELEKDGGGNSMGDFPKVKYVKVTRIGSKNADVLVTTKAGKKQNLTFVMVLEEGRWKMDGYGR